MAQVVPAQKGKRTTDLIDISPGYYDEESGDFSRFEEVKTKSFICPDSPDNLCPVDGVMNSAIKDFETNEFVNTENWCTSADWGTGRCEFEYNGTVLPRLTGVQRREDNFLMSLMDSLLADLLESQNSNEALAKELKAEKEFSDMLIYLLLGVTLVFELLFFLLGYHHWKVLKRQAVYLIVRYPNSCHEHERTHQS